MKSTSTCTRLGAAVFLALVLLTAPLAAAQPRKSPRAAARVEVPQWSAAIAWLSAFLGLSAPAVEKITPPPVEPPPPSGGLTWDDLWNGSCVDPQGRPRPCGF